MSQAVKRKGSAIIGWPADWWGGGGERVANALASEVFTVVACPSLVMECARPLAMVCGSCSAYQGGRTRVGEVDTCRQLGHPNDQEM